MCFANQIHFRHSPLGVLAQCPTDVERAPSKCLGVGIRSVNLDRAVPKAFEIR